MNVAAAAILVLCALVPIAWIATMTASDGDQDQAVTPERSHTGTVRLTGHALNGEYDREQPDWLPATLPATPAQPLLRAPRVSAGRVAPIANLITLRDPAGWPVVSYATGQRWPAWEGTT